MLKAVTKLFGNENEKILKRYRKKVVQINALESEMETLKDEDFPGRTEQFRERMKEGAVEDDLLPEAFALVREAARRVIGERHYDVQLMGGMAKFIRGFAVYLRKCVNSGESSNRLYRFDTFLPSLAKLV